MMRFTSCKECNKKLSYKTHKPILCNDCKSSSKVKKQKKSYASKEEEKIFAILDKVFPDAGYIDQGFYSFLISPRGYLMQLDRYYPRYNLAFEINGKQHYKYSKHFHKTEENFQYQQECDKLKVEICKSKGITVIQIPYFRKTTVESIPLEIQAVNPDLYKKIWG